LLVKRWEEMDDPRTLEDVARRVREHIVRIAGMPGGCHLGGALSSVEILVSLYFGLLRLDPNDASWPERDLFVFSKGHAAAALYAVLAERGYLSTELLGTYCAAGSSLLGHPTRAIPGVEFATGSVGHGLSLGVGVALGLRHRGGGARRVFVLLGDGELQEGSVWEAVMTAAHQRLDNLVAIVDRNGWQISGRTEECLSLEPLADRWRSFGWAAREVDGHDLTGLIKTLGELPASTGQPTVLIARTVKGRGVPMLEDRKKSHYVKLTPPLHARALAGLRNRREREQ
jgi:transketolase